MMLQCGDYWLDLSRPRIMGIVNLTPDSFSGDGVGHDVDAAIAHARHQWAAGADLLDVGAESTRPGAIPVAVDEEKRRLLPVLEELVTWGVPISVDTYKPSIMADVIRLGVAMINDIQGLRDPAAVDSVSKANCAVCVMHMQGAPLTMQTAPRYADVRAEVRAFLQQQADVCRASGIGPERLVMDPGFGFGKTVSDNYRLLSNLSMFGLDRYPVLAGVSRKSMIGAVTGRPSGEARLAGSVAGALLAVERGAAVVRVHDVAATCDALAVWAALREEDNNGT